MNPSMRLLAARRTFILSFCNPIVQTHRTYAAAAPVKGIKPPIKIHTLEGTYASALYSASAHSNTALNEIEKSLSAIGQKLDSDAKLNSIVVNPSVSHKEKSEVIQLLTQVGGGGAEALKAVRNLLEVMSEHGRLRQLDGVVNAFQRIMRAHKGEVDVIVTSAQPLDSRVLTRLEQAISKSSLITKGQKVRMENKVSDTIMGGLIVEIGDRTIDLSVQSRVSKLNHLLYETL